MARSFRDKSLITISFGFDSSCSFVFYDGFFFFQWYYNSLKRKDQQVQPGEKIWNVQNAEMRFQMLPNTHKGLINGRLHGFSILFEDFMLPKIMLISIL